MQLSAKTKVFTQTRGFPFNLPDEMCESAVSSAHTGFLVRFRVLCVLV